MKNVYLNIETNDLLCYIKIKDFGILQGIKIIEKISRGRMIGKLWVKKMFFWLLFEIYHISRRNKIKIIRFNRVTDALSCIQWEQFIEARLPFLEKFQFDFTCHQCSFRLLVDLASITVPFKTPFWLNKSWFITCDYIRRLRSIRIYSIPICVSDFYYVSELDKVSCSTHDNMNNG
jgi:hypothetical protein